MSCARCWQSRKSFKEAEQQRAPYRAVLEGSAGASLQLRTHAVVGIGLERLVW